MENSPGTTADSSRVCNSGVEVEFPWQSEVNTSYLVEFKTELPGVAWLPLMNCVPGDGKVLKHYDKVAPKDPKRFYRVTTNYVSSLG